MHLKTEHQNMRQKLIHVWREIDESTIITGDVNTPVSEMDRSRRQKFSEDIAKLNSTINLLDIIDIYRRLHLRTADDIFFSSSHRTFTKMDYIMGHKTHLNLLKRIDLKKHALKPPQWEAHAPQWRVATDHHN